MRFRGDFETLSFVYIQKDELGVGLDDVGGEATDRPFGVGVPFRDAPAGD